jgi:hypothetical protein
MNRKWSLAPMNPLDLLLLCRIRKSNRHISALNRHRHQPLGCQDSPVRTTPKYKMDSYDRPQHNEASPTSICPPMLAISINKDLRRSTATNPRRSHPILLQLTSHQDCVASPWPRRQQSMQEGARRPATAAICMKQDRWYLPKAPEYR